jgi:hypothetical protein
MHGFRLGREWRRDRVTDLSLNRNVAIGRIDRARLQLLGAAVMRRIDELGFTVPLSGNWIDTQTGGLVLRITSGREQIAELADRKPRRPHRRALAPIASLIRRTSVASAL